MFRNPEMGAAYRLIAAEGPSAFYKGAIAQALLKTSQRLGGKLDAADLAEFEPEWVQPISTEYRGWKVYELPPNGQGIAALEMLNIFSLFPMPQYESARRGGIAHADRSAEAGICGSASIRGRSALQQDAGGRDAIHGLCARARAADRSPARQLPGGGGRSTGHPQRHDLSGGHRPRGQHRVADSELYQHFGSGVVVDGYGFALQNRGGLFDMDPQHPNALAPRKRPFHTIIPAFMEKGRYTYRLRHHGRA